MKMTKLALVMGALLCMAVSAQANSLTWGSAWAYSTNPDASFNAGYYSAGIVNGDAWLLVLSANNTVGISVDNTGVLTANGSTLETFTYNAWFQSFAAGDAASANVIPGNFYAVVVYDAAHQMYGISDVVAGSSTGMSAGPPEMPGAALFGNNIVSLGPPVAYEGEDNLYYMRADQQAIPEPTSLALLALGAVALGLRRKFRK